MKKILIWDTVVLKDSGGPSGYLFNIHEYLKKKPNDQIVFLSDLTRLQKEKDQHHETKKKNILDFFCQLIPLSIKKTAPMLFLKKTVDNILYLHLFLWKQFQINPINIPPFIELNDFDFIHIHLIPDLLRFKKNFPFYKGKTILTSHCPCSWTDETISYEKPWMRFFRPILLHHEICAYKQADYIMFPCKEAREPYEKVSKIKKTFHSFESKFFYVPTGILDASLKKEESINFKKLGIGDSDFVIGFFGRHEAIKGYDILKNVAGKQLSKHRHLFFLCAGTGKIAPLNHAHWIELGFVNNIQSILPRCDLYILPNRDTFFDLITLELLRAGTIVILSDNGGNRYFKNLPTNETIGISFFSPNNETGLIEMIDYEIEAKSKNPKNIVQRKMANSLLFQKYFSTKCFLTNYTNTIQNII